MRDLKIKFGDARDSAQQSINVNIHEGPEQGIDLEAVRMLLGEVRQAFEQRGIPDGARAQLGREAAAVEHEAREKKPAIDRIEGALKRMSSILETVGLLGGTVVATLGKLKVLFGIA